jgi:DNA transformation protein and related proteins
VKEDSFRDFVLEQLSSIRPLFCRPMFGGYGLYQGDTFFGIVHKGRLYFKVDDAGRALYVDAGSSPFRPSAKQILASFYEVPADVLESTPHIAEWAARAVDAAKK